MARRVTTRKTVTARTMKRRARVAAAEAAAKEHAKRHGAEPETLGQARVWARKARRYEIAGLCPRCATQAAYGHANGFNVILDPCTTCQPIVNSFPHAGPRGSKWRKILDKLEYMSEAELGAWLDTHAPEQQA